MGINVMNKILRYTVGSAAFALITACGGGGGGGDVNSVAAPTAAFATLTVNKNGLYDSAPFSTSTNFIQNSSTGYFVSSFISQEWTGANMRYTTGYVNPTSGSLYSYKVNDRLTMELWWSVSDVNYDISRTSPSNDSSALPMDALAAAPETKIFGGLNNDVTFALSNTSEIDLRGGNDTLRLSQNFSAYQFSRVAGSVSSVSISRNGTTLVKNVENFEFADRTRTLTEILAAIP
jgi:hypothetical protein